MFNEALRNMPLLFSQMTCVEEMGFNATYCAHQDTMAKADADRVQRRASTLTNDAVTGQACLQVIVMIFIARASDHYGRRIAMFFVVFGNALDCAAFALVRVSAPRRDVARCAAFTSHRYRWLQVPDVLVAVHSAIGVFGGQCKRGRSSCVSFPSLKGAAAQT